MESIKEKYDEVSIIAITESKKVIELGEFEYRITRESAPIYSMGSPSPRSFSYGRRGVTGSLTVGNAMDVTTLDEENFEIHLTTVSKGERKRMVLKDVKITAWAMDTNDPSRFVKFKASFVATPDIYMQPEEVRLTNRSWAKHILQKEY